MNTENVSTDPYAVAKELAARHAVLRHISSGMSIGLGSGSTAAYCVTALAERIASEGLVLNRVTSTSRGTADLAVAHGIKLIDELDPADGPLDVTIDGADEADPDLNLIKGGGGACLREKLIALSTTKEVIVVDPRKLVDRLGLTFPLPVVVTPFEWRCTAARVQEVIGRPFVRRVRDGAPFVTDDGLTILDFVPGAIDDPAAMEQALKAIPGVVDVGLFINIARVLVVGHLDGRVEEILPRKQT